MIISVINSLIILLEFDINDLPVISEGDGLEPAGNW